MDCNHVQLSNKPIVYSCTGKCQDWNSLLCYIYAMLSLCIYIMIYHIKLLIYLSPRYSLFCILQWTSPKYSSVQTKATSYRCNTVWTQFGCPRFRTCHWDHPFHTDPEFPGKIGVKKLGRHSTGSSDRITMFLHTETPGLLQREAESTNRSNQIGFLH